VNRRSFITGLVSSFVVLPSATTYARKWVKQQSSLFTPELCWMTIGYEKLWFRVVVSQVKCFGNIKPFESMYGEVDWQPNQLLRK
jgi:hypothetical protein